MTQDIKMWRYVLPPVNYEDWATIHMDSKGFFAVVSDWGNYVYQWHGFEGDFREFIVKADDEYIARKFAARWPREPDLQASLESLRRALDEHADGQSDPEPILDDLDELTRVTDEFKLLEWLADTILPDAYDYVVYRRCPHASQFVQKVLPRLRELLRQQLQAGDDLEAASHV
jgi:hypothetical protein